MKDHRPISSVLGKNIEHDATLVMTIRAADRPTMEQAGRDLGIALTFAPKGNFCFNVYAEHDAQLVRNRYRYIKITL